MQSGVGLIEHQKMGGWELTEIVRRYAHSALNHLQQYAEKLDGLLKGYSTNLAHIKKPVTEIICNRLIYMGRAGFEPATR